MVSFFLWRSLYTYISRLMASGFFLFFFLLVFYDPFSCYVFGKHNYNIIMSLQRIFVMKIFSHKHTWNYFNFWIEIARRKKEPMQQNCGKFFFLSSEIFICFEFSIIQNLFSLMNRKINKFGINALF
jgi:hypothetical protein